MTRTPLRKWHPGKLVILWAWGVVVMVLCAQALQKDPAPTVGIVLIIVFLLAPTLLSVITWRWLGGREDS